MSKIRGNYDRRRVRWCRWKAKVLQSILVLPKFKFAKKNFKPPVPRHRNPALTPPSGQKCYLLELPPELRSYIWDLVVVRPGSINIMDLQLGPPGTQRTIKMPQPSLTMACQQIRSETLQMFYGANTFSCAVALTGTEHADVLSRFYDAVGPVYMKLIKQLRISVRIPLAPTGGHWIHLVQLLCKPTHILPRSGFISIYLSSGTGLDGDQKWFRHLVGDLSKLGDAWQSAWGRPSRKKHVRKQMLLWLREHHREEYGELIAELERHVKKEERKRNSRVLKAIKARE